MFRWHRDLLFQFRLHFFRRRVGIFGLFFFLCCFYFLLKGHVNFYISTFVLSKLYSTKETDWKFRCVVEKNLVGIEKVNHDAIETSSKNLKVSLNHPDAIDAGHYHAVVTDIFHETIYSTGRPWREGDFRQTKRSRDAAASPPPTECRLRAGAVFMTCSRHVVH